MLTFIRKYHEQFNRSPSAREIAASCGSTYWTIYSRMKRMAGKGLMRLKDNRYGDIVLLDVPFAVRP